jgi:hypothetical protein
MTLSSSSRQHRKSMLPTPRLSSRLSSRRAASGDTSRIARRVPSPLVRTSGNNSSITQARAPRPAATYNLSLPDMVPRRAGSPSRIPWPSGQPSCPTPQEQSEASSLTDALDTPRPEVKRVDAQYSTPPASAETKNERSKGQEGRVIPTQHQDTETRDPALPARQSSRRPASTALTSFSRIENAPSSPRDSGPPALATKKSALARGGVSGKENRRPQTRTRVPAPPATSIAPIAPRSVRRQPVAAAEPSRASFRETSPRPLVIRKQPSRSLGTGASQGHSQVGPDAAAAPVVVPEGVKALMGDVDRFAKEWTEMFDDLFAGTDGREDGLSKLGASTRIHPAPQSESAGDPLRTESPAAGKRAQELLLPEALGTAASVGTSQTSALESSNGVHFDVTPASLARWQHRDNAMVRDAPVGEEPVREQPLYRQSPTLISMLGTRPTWCSLCLGIRSAYR